MDQLFDATLMGDDDDGGGDEALPGGADYGEKEAEAAPQPQSAPRGTAAGAGAGVGAGASAAAEFGFDPFAMDDEDDEGGDEALPGGPGDDDDDEGEAGATSGAAEGKVEHTLAPIREARVQSKGRRAVAVAPASGQGGDDFVGGGAASGGGEMGVSLGAAPVSHSGAPGGPSLHESKSGGLVDLTGGAGSGGGGTLGGPDDPATMAAGGGPSKANAVSATTLGLGDTSALQRDAQLNAEREVTMAHQAARVEELQAAVERLTATVDAKVRRGATCAPPPPCPMPRGVSPSHAPPPPLPPPQDAALKEANQLRSKATKRLNAALAQKDLELRQLKDVHKSTIETMAAAAARKVRACSSLTAQ